MRNQRYSALLWCSICVFVIFTFLPMMLLNHDSRMDYADKSFVVLAKEWEISYGDDLTDNSEWFPFDAATRAALADYEGSIWLKRPMPDLEWNNPYLFFSLMRQFEVFLDGERIYSFNMDNRYTRLNPLRTLHPVNVEPGLSGKLLLLHAKWNKDPLIGNDLVLAGESGQFLYISIISETAFLLDSFIALLAGAIGLVLFIVRRERIYGWFALFCFAVGMGLLLSCRTLQWFVDMSRIYYWEQLLTPLAIWACVGFYANALNINRESLIRRIHAVLGSFLLFYIGAAVFAPLFFSQSAASLDAPMAIAGFVIVTFFMARRSGRNGARKNKAGGSDASGPNVGGPNDSEMERRWLLRGYWTFAVGGVASMTAYTFPNLLTNLHNSNHYLYRVIEGMIPNVMLLFIICTTMVMVGRVRRVYLESERNAAELREKNKELEQFHRNLEQLVETRTSELEKANRTLAVTLREKAETLAEMSVLEERNRIAYEMHDVVGHTLTAAIVQLEATKRIATREMAMPLEKLELLSELVRKGLDDIRKAVRLMKTDEEEPLPLDAALRELIQYTEDTMEITVDCAITLPPNLMLGRMTEGVLYHALQEGLTNGIRHGRSGHFRFSLNCEDGQLRFLLVNDGEPFGSALPGFGLSSMMERVELLGGEVSLGSAAAEDGSPMGCELSIRIPLS